MEVERKRVSEFSEWEKRARDAAQKAVLGQRTDEQVASDRWGELRKEIDRDIATINDIDAGSLTYSRTVFTSNISGRLQRLSTNSQAALVRQALEHIRQRQASMRKPLFTDRNTVWTLADTAQEAAVAPKGTGEDVLNEYDGGRIVNNHDAERVQIFLDVKPDEALRAKLKGSGWRWSPLAGAWQRKNTNAALSSATQMMAGFEVKAVRVAAESANRPEAVMPATERTDQGEQFIVDGLRPVTDRDRAEAAMGKPLQPKKRQKAADEGLFDVAGRAQQDLFSREAAASAGARSLGVPKMADPPIFSHSDSARLKDHPDCTAAKAGDRAAAIRFVSDIVDPVTVDEARSRFGEEVICAPAAAEEASGRNAIPATVAAYYAEFSGGAVEPSIIQTVRAHHAGAKPMERLISRPLFGGPVKPGGRYVLVDDVSTMGGTLAEMAHHIQANGGQVIGTIALANASRSGQFSPTRLQVRTIEVRYGDAIRQLFGIAPTGLTADEARYILGFRDADTLRAAAAKAGDERNRRLGKAGVQRDAAGEGSADSVKPNENNSLRLAPEFERGTCSRRSQCPQRSRPASSASPQRTEPQAINPLLLALSAIRAWFLPNEM